MKLVWIAAMLLMFWIVFWKSFKIGGNAVHVLAVAALVLIVVGLLKRQKQPSPTDDGQG